MDGEEYGKVLGSDGKLRLSSVGWWASNDTTTSATTAQKKAKARERGTQLANTIVNAGGPMELSQYNGYMPWGSREHIIVWQGRNLTPPTQRGIWAANSITPEWFDGLTNNPGITKFRWFDSSFYKNTQNGLTMAQSCALNEDAFSRYPIGNKPNCTWAPMVWLTSSNTAVEPYAYSRDVPYVHTQLMECRAGTPDNGNEILIYGQERAMDSLTGRPPPYGTTGTGSSGGYLDYRASMIQVSQ